MLSQEVEESLSAARALSPQDVQALSSDGVTVLDTRTPDEFGAGHVPSAINIGLDGNYAPWVGRIVLPGTPVIVVTQPGRETEAMTRLVRVGYEQILGWLSGGMPAWEKSGSEVATVPQLDPTTLHNLLPGTLPVRVLDVRSAEEWEAGHVPGAIHIPLSELETRLSEAPEAPLAVMCRSGYRSTIACSI